MKAIIVQQGSGEVVSKYFEKSSSAFDEEAGDSVHPDREQLRIDFEERAKALLAAPDLISRAIPFVRELLDGRQRWIATSFAQTVMAAPATVEIGRIAMGIVALRYDYDDFAWDLFDLAGRDAAIRLAPGEFFGMWLEREPMAARQHLLEAPSDAIDPSSLWNIARRAGAMKDYDLLALLIERAAAIDPDLRQLSEEDRTDFGWTRAYLASHPDRDHPVVVPADTINLGILDYKQLDRGRATANIGDYIQTLAFLSNLARFQSVSYDDSALGRKLESLKSRIAPERRLTKRTAQIRPVAVNRDFSSWDEIPEPTWVFAYGWYMHQVFDTMFDFPFNKNIRPIFISFHVNRRQMLSEKAVDYLKTYQPIGCRDWSTVYLLREKGVQAFFSGCVTTTIGQIFNDDSPQVGEDTIALVDYVSRGDDEFAGLNVVSYSQGVDEVRDLNLVDALDAADELLHSYRRYPKIATSRLHCYLPCTSMGLDVTFKPKQRGDIRFEGLMRLGKPRFERMRSNVAEKLELMLRLIFNGASEERVYEKWCTICAADLEAAEIYCRELPPLPAPSFDIVATVDTIRSGSITFNPLPEGANAVNLAVAFDNNLVGIMPAAMESAVANLSRPAVVHVLARGIAHEFWADFARDFPETEFRIFDFDGVDYGADLNLVKRTTPSTIDRLLLPDLLPEVDRLVYLDVDIVVQGDLARLYDLDMGDRPLAARSSTKGWRNGSDVLERAVSRQRPAKAWEARRRMYDAGKLDFTAFNAGVMVLNLQRMRTDRSAWLTVPWVENYGMNDQDALNFYARSERVELDDIWNAIPGEEITGDDGILHFAGMAKPWGRYYVSRSEDYHRYLARYQARREKRLSGAAV